MGSKSGPYLPLMPNLPSDYVEYNLNFFTLGSGRDASGGPPERWGGTVTHRRRWSPIRDGKASTDFASLAASSGAASSSQKTEAVRRPPPHPGTERNTREHSREHNLGSPFLRYLIILKK
jgi:hypothetical protein